MVPARVCAWDVLFKLHGCNLASEATRASDLVNCICCVFQQSFQKGFEAINGGDQKMV